MTLTGTRVRHIGQVDSGFAFRVAGFCAFELLEWGVHQIMGRGPFTAAQMGGHK